MSASTPGERALVARIASATRWAQVTTPAERAAAMKPLRDGFLSSFERQADPDGTMDPVQRAKVAESLRSAHFARLALKSAQAKRLRKQAAALEAQAARRAKQAATLEAEITDLAGDAA